MNIFVLDIDPECQFWDKFQNAVKNGKVPFHNAAIASQREAKKD